METIQPATLDDVPQLAALLGVLFAQEAELEPDRQKQERALRLIIQSAHAGRIFAAREAREGGEGGQVVGMVSLLFSISTAEGGPVCWLEDMIVHPDRRGGGLGTRLLQHAIAYARDEGFSRIMLLTDQANAGAIRFYERQGFATSSMTALRLPVKTCP